MNHFSSYISKLSSFSAELRRSVAKTATEIMTKIIKDFDYKSHVTGLLLGNVQSGKTSQMLGVVAKMADEDFKFFVILTTDNIYLQTQTYNRVQESLETFRVCGESDDINFLQTKLRKPTILVLKKNTNVLKRWKNLIGSSDFLKGQPVVVIDDEADAASLNTLVNKKRFSEINKHIRAIKNLFPSSIYLQVTATPQAVILQTALSDIKPSFIQYFPPGKSYIGGDFIYSEPRSYCIKLTPENELDDIKRDADEIPIGLKESLLCYLIISSEFRIKKRGTCNFLVHPSVKITDHEKFAKILGEHLNTFLAQLEDIHDRAAFWSELKDLWRDLQKTQPDISSFDDIREQAEIFLTNMDFSIVVLNSKSPQDVNYSKGYNIIIGGNTLGRGVTFPNLQVVYYCRKAKTPQADTYWQHSRIFGYDRRKGLVRIFIPPSLLKLFTEINNSNRLLINQVIENNSLEGIQLIFPNKIKPTRSNVLDKTAINIIVGGVNVFAIDPIQSHTKTLDQLLDGYSERFTEISGIEMLDLLKYVGDKAASAWNSAKYINCVKALITKRPYQQFALIVRHDSNVSKGTGTLLSPMDRQIGDRLKDYATLTLYRLNGNKAQGWDGKPFWAPNIKFPFDTCFYDTIEI